MPSSAATEAVILDLPEPVLLRALHVLRAPESSDLEASLAASVLAVAVQRGTRLPRWANTIIAKIADRRRR